MAHLTKFSFEFFCQMFTEDASQPFLYHGAKKSKMTKNSNQGGSCLKRPPNGARKMVVIDTYRFFEALLNSCERCGTHTFDLRNDKSRQSGASGGLMRWFFCKFAVWYVAVLTVNMGTKQPFSFLLVAKDRENPVAGAKKCQLLVALDRWSPNTVQFEWQTLCAWKIGR